MAGAVTTCAYTSSAPAGVFLGVHGAQPFIGG